MNLNTMLRRNIFLSLLLAGTLCAEFVCAQPDNDALLREARTKIVESIAKLPRYTCIQTIRRSRFDPFYESRKRGCGERQNVWLTWTDQLKLDVTISEGAEIFSWAGAREFQSPDVPRTRARSRTVLGRVPISRAASGQPLRDQTELQVRRCGNAGIRRQILD